MSKHGPGHEPPVTIPEYFRESVNRFGTYSALASKNCGKWEVLTYNHYFEACRKAAKALLKTGTRIRTGSESETAAERQ
ncbi:Long-chain-fatty-acid--CoA ligase ACSBG2 [Myotis brandtii]|uniref:Long-chain-fatty-acid--CoA ligase ACSBG2 n=1 Tax=Myotis brandtii TaxID=109478 RepID=S7NN16_MYOBR|nr:Long-chain-fatty-acid--CoA ligase ACSBG2 [Myotis brandtii]